jgi:hypothetical protein
MSTEYYELSDDFTGKSGIVTFAVSVDEENPKNTNVGFSYTAPDEKYDQESARKSAEESMHTPDPKYRLVSRLSREEYSLVDIARSAWNNHRAAQKFVVSKGATISNGMPDWALKLDLGRKAHMLFVAKVEKEA